LRKYESPRPRTWTISVLKPSFTADATASSIAWGDVRRVRSIHSPRTPSAAPSAGATRAEITTPITAKASVRMGETPGILADLEELSQSRFGVLADGVAHEVVGLAQTRHGLR